MIYIEKTKTNILIGLSTIDIITSKNNIYEILQNDYIISGIIEELNRYLIINYLKLRSRDCLAVARAASAVAEAVIVIRKFRLEDCMEAPSPILPDSCTRTLAEFRFHAS